MTNLIFPARVTFQVEVYDRGERRPYDGKPVVLSVRTFARAKNDYRLGPLFTDERGHLEVTSRQLELYAGAVLSRGIMDYQDIHEAFGFVEIVHWTAADIARAIEARTSYWTSLHEGEAELYGSFDRLMERLRDSGNHLLEPPEMSGRLRDEWTDPSRTVEYIYTVMRASSA